MTSAFTPSAAIRSRHSSAYSRTSPIGFGPYGWRAVSPTYTIDSCGSWSITERATVKPPKPESKMPIGASGRVSASTSALVRSCTDARLERRTPAWEHTRPTSLEMRITDLTAGTVARMRLGPISCLLAVALLVPTGGATAQEPTPAVPETAAPRVLGISVDGLNTQAIRKLGRSGAPTLYRLLAEGAGTLNARTEYEQNVTLPNHTGMLTSRRIDRRHGGHVLIWNDDRRRMTVQRAAGRPVKSVFSVVHASGGTGALFSTKEKFGIFKRSWPRGIDHFVIDEDQGRLVRAATADLLRADRTFTFLHV